MTYIYSLEKSPDNMKDYLNKMFQRDEYSRAHEPHKAIQINE